MRAPWRREVFCLFLSLYHSSSQSEGPGPTASAFRKCRFLGPPSKPTEKNSGREPKKMWLNQPSRWLRSTAVWELLPPTLALKYLETITSPATQRITSCFMSKFISLKLCRAWYTVCTSAETPLRVTAQSGAQQKGEMKTGLAVGRGWGNKGWSLPLPITIDR